MRHPLSLRLHLRRLLAVLLIALAASCAPAVPPRPAVAEETSKAQDADPSVDSAAVKTVRVGWLVDNQGFQSGTPGGYLSGWGYEYLQTLSYYTPGWRYEYVTGTFSELMDKLERGEIDLMPNISYTPERAQKMLFSANPQGTEHYYIYAKPSRSDLAKGDPQALNGLTIDCNKGLMQTQAGQEWLKGKGITCTYKYYDTANEIFSALASDDVDAIIMNDTVTSSDAMAMFDVGSSDYYFVTPLGRQDLMDDINAAMTALRSTNPPL